MRETERKWSHEKKEDRGAYLRRLKRTAMSLTEEEANAAFDIMKRRCQTLKLARGGPMEG